MGWGRFTFAKTFCLPYGNFDFLSLIRYGDKDPGGSPVTEYGCIDVGYRKNPDLPKFENPDLWIPTFSNPIFIVNSDFGIENCDFIFFI